MAQSARLKTAMRGFYLDRTIAGEAIATLAVAAAIAILRVIQ
jgi:hypothetical protein